MKNAKNSDILFSMNTLTYCQVVPCMQLIIVCMPDITSAQRYSPYKLNPCMQVTTYVAINV